jgi:hydrogenase maturation protein HypF
LAGTISSHRQRILVRGAVQGVGFRPFVYRLASGMGLDGWVSNSGSGVVLEVQGPAGSLGAFARRLVEEAPPSARPEIAGISDIPAEGRSGFEIRASSGGSLEAVILPDLATCPDCLREILDPGDRRYLYPFTNCTNCGPRFTIVRSLPYDRRNTTMAAFEMCEACRREYEDPRDRRFHAQPNACPACGPRLELLDPSGRSLGTGHPALLEAAESIRRGRILAMKGLGGFHLMADARNPDAIAELRSRKSRPSKPLALMVQDTGEALGACVVSEGERAILESPEAPILLLRRRTDIPEASALPRILAPGNPCLGLMLPHSPHQHLLMRELGFPVVATSGNLSEETVCTDEGEALRRLAGIADLFLVHNRPIARHADDSVVMVLDDGELVLRRSRGYAPLPVRVRPVPGPVLALGGHLKNTVALSTGDQAFVSQHIGDMDTAESVRTFRGVVSGLCEMYGSRPAIVARDLHPDYATTAMAGDYGADVLAVQHHHAHILSCMAENGLEGPVLGVALDGSGYGPDGTVWGGEFLAVDGEGACRRIAHLRQFRLPGGGKAVEEPRRSAAGVLFEMGEYPASVAGMYPGSFSIGEAEAISDMISGSVNSPLTSSCGRLFDAVASIAGLCQVSDFEGQAAMGLEFAMEGIGGNGCFEILFDPSRTPAVLDWVPLVRAVITALGTGMPIREISLRFHNGLVEGIVGIAKHAGIRDVALSGGCFQNRYLLSRAMLRLRAEGFDPHRHRRIPPNDGGISLGQAVAAGVAVRAGRN